MIPYDHDYAGIRRKEHMMDIRTAFDGEHIWIFLNGVHSWADGCYTHEWTHCMLPHTLDDIVMSVKNAMYLYDYQVNVIPQLREELGDIASVLYFKDGDEI
uniref:Uncharacterized protein n=1 Tax=viral metagenome TaxID=1070528 RepID=A0A6M3ISI0_9ZZZZ